MIDAMNLSILIGAGLIAVSILTSLISFRVGAPLLLIFLGVGLLAGEDGFGGIEFDDVAAAYFIGSIALAVILFDSGFETPLHSYRLAAWPAVTLATLGVLITAAIFGAAAHLLFGFPWIEALLLGAILGSTDAAAVFFLLRVGGITLRDRVRSTLEIESGTNDPMAIFLTLILVELAVSGLFSEALSWELLRRFGVQIALGGVMGALGGYALVQTINRLEFIERGLYPLLSLSLALCLFAAVSMLGGSGFLAVYIAGLVAGNARLRNAHSLRRFQSGMTWLAQIAMFLTLGLLATPSEFLHVLAPALVLAVVLMFLARPLAVWLCLLPYGFSRNETTFVAWVGLRGAVSILLGILPIIGGLPNGQTLFNMAFLIVLASLLTQGWSIRPMAKWLGLVVPPRTGPLERVELDLPDTSVHELVVYRVTPNSPVVGGERIPRWARPSLIVRDGRSMRLHNAGRLQPGDHVYIFATPEQLRLLDRLFAAPTPLSQDDRDFFGDFALDPGVRLRDIVTLYGAEVPAADLDLTVAERLKREFGGTLELGDRITLGPIELIVREIAPDGQVASVGLAVEPSPAARPRLPLFQTRKEIQVYLRGLWRRDRRRRTGASKTDGETEAAPVPPPPHAEGLAPDEAPAAERPVAVNER